MGTPLCPVLANILWVFIEKYYKLHVYLYYIDDTVSIFDSTTDAEAFHTQLHSRHHPSIYDASGKWLYFAFFSMYLLNANVVYLS